MFLVLNLQRQRLKRPINLSQLHTRRLHLKLATRPQRLHIRLPKLITKLQRLHIRRPKLAIRHQRLLIRLPKLITWLLRPRIRRLNSRHTRHPLLMLPLNRCTRRPLLMPPLNRRTRHPLLTLLLTPHLLPTRLLPIQVTGRLASSNPTARSSSSTQSTLTPTMASDSTHPASSRLACR
jgi:hypothetical protein